MNRKELLATLREAGYEGPDDLAKIKEWLGEGSINVDGKTVDIEKAFKTVYVTGDADEDIQVVESEPQTEMAEEDEESEADMKSVLAEVKKLRKTVADAEGRKKLGRVQRDIYLGGKAPAYSDGRYKRYQKKIDTGKAAYSDPEIAEKAGAFFRLVAMGDRGYDKRQSDIDIVGKANVTNLNHLGGVLVPEEINAELIDLKLAYGDARELAYNRPMATEVENRPRRTSGLTVYSPGEGNAITESNANYDNVPLVAREMATLATLSNALLIESAIDIADETTEEIAQAFAQTEDDMYFIGDGTSTYFGVTGCTNALSGLSGTVANIAGLQVGSGNAYSELTLADFHGVMARLPEYKRKGSEARWVFNKAFWHNVPERLASAAGGVTYTELTSGRRVPMFLGAPVVWSNSMPKTEANSQVCALYGHYDLGSMFGEVIGSTTVATSDQRYFDQNKIAIRGIQKVAINVHDVGNADATAANRQAGPIVGLITAAS